MASGSSKSDRVGGDQQESDPSILSPIEDMHHDKYCLMDERGDHGTSSKFSMSNLEDLKDLDALVNIIQDLKDDWYWYEGLVARHDTESKEDLIEDLMEILKDIWYERYCYINSLLDGNSNIEDKEFDIKRYERYMKRFKYIEDMKDFDKWYERKKRGPLILSPTEDMHEVLMDERKARGTSILRNLIIGLADKWYENTVCTFIGEFSLENGMRNTARGTSNKSSLKDLIKGLKDKWYERITARHGTSNKSKEDLIKEMEDKWRRCERRYFARLRDKLNRMPDDLDDLIDELYMYCLKKEECNERDIAQSYSQSAAQSSCTLSIISTGDKRDDDGKIKSTESSDSERIAIDEDSNIQNEGYNFSEAASELPEAKEYDSVIDKNLPDTATVLATPDGGKLYLVGTAHFSVESQNDVSKVIQAVQPHIVAVELCRARVAVLQMDEEVLFDHAKNIDYKTIMYAIREEGMYDGLVRILFLRMSAYVSKQLGMPPGGEFRRAFEEAKKLPNCIVHLADRPLDITLQRAIRSLSWWQTIKLGWNLVVMKDPITQEDVELCKQRSMLDEIMAKMEREFPVLGEVFIRERDIYLTNSLQLACQPSTHIFNHTSKPVRVVGIVGIGHIPGIIENWGKVKSTDIPPIMRIPPPSLSGKILKFTIKASVLGAVIYVGYKVVAVPAAFTFRALKSSVQGLLQVGAAR